MGGGGGGDEEVWLGGGGWVGEEGGGLAGVGMTWVEGGVSRCLLGDMVWGGKVHSKSSSTNKHKVYECF